MQVSMNDVITLHNIYRRLVRKEEGLMRWARRNKSLAQWNRAQINECTSCNEKYILTKSRISTDNDHWSSAAYSTYCTQCVADHLGWQAEKQFMNARWDKEDRVLLTQKGHEALASCPD